MGTSSRLKLPPHEVVEHVSNRVAPRPHGFALLYPLKPRHRGPLRLLVVDVVEDVGPDSIEVLRILSPRLILVELRPIPFLDEDLREELDDLLIEDGCVLPELAEALGKLRM